MLAGQGGWVRSAREEVTVGRRAHKSFLLLVPEVAANGDNLASLGNEVTDTHDFRTNIELILQLRVFQCYRA